MGYEALATYPGQGTNPMRTIDNSTSRWQCPGDLSIENLEQLGWRGIDKQILGSLVRDWPAESEAHRARLLLQQLQQNPDRRAVATALNGLRPGGQEIPGKYEGIGQATGRVVALTSASLDSAKS